LLGQAGLIAPLPEAIAKSICRKWPPEFCHEKCQRIGWRRIDDLFEFGGHRHVERDWIAGSVLLLGEVKPTVAQVLPS
jgi:hypothetical protein